MSTTEEVIEEVVETVPKLTEAKNMGSADGLYLPKSSLVKSGVGVFLLVAGAGFAGYKFAQKRLETKYAQIAEDEINQAKAFYNEAAKKRASVDVDVKADASPFVEGIGDAAEALLRYKGTPEKEEDVEEGSVEVFLEDRMGDDDDFDYEEELERRRENPDDPYIIHRDEHMQNEGDFSQTTITYYAGDDTLADEQDKEIPFIDPIVGEENLEKFGYGSGDNNILYIRNENLSTDFEVVRSEGKYAHEVLGLEHSDGGARAHQRRNRLPKFRDDDER